MVEHAYTNFYRLVSASYQATTFLKSQNQIWIELENDARRLHDFVTFSPDGAQRMGLVRLDTSKVGSWEWLVPPEDLDRFSRRIVVWREPWTEIGMFTVELSLICHRCEMRVVHCYTCTLCPYSPFVVVGDSRDSTVGALPHLPCKSFCFLGD